VCSSGYAATDTSWKKDAANSSALTVTQMEAEPQQNSPCVRGMTRLSQILLGGTAAAGLPSIPTGGWSSTAKATTEPTTLTNHKARKSIITNHKAPTQNITNHKAPTSKMPQASGSSGPKIIENWNG
jgi:hypothetical protein